MPGVEVLRAKMTRHEQRRSPRELKAGLFDRHDRGERDESRRTEQGRRRPWSRPATASWPPTNPPAPSRSASTRSASNRTEDSRRDYREMLFRSTEAMKHISGVILYDETIWQKAKDGTPLVELIKKAGALPGIKVDEGTKPLPNCPGEVDHRRPRQARRPAAEILRAGRALRQVARRDRHRRRHSELHLPSRPTRMRSRAMPRSARRRRSCRSSSRKC